MFEAIYLIIGIIFGVLGIWLLSVKPLKEALHVEVQNSQEKDDLTNKLNNENSVLNERLTSSRRRIRITVFLQYCEIFGSSRRG